ncbi:methyltransferase domain-containing protein [Streptomyces mirabilis]|uniref:methyltransferase domain-containing protein n=1 Tax=Streptomyces mirabilis TaxID=68239 RepID=UPI0036648C89
MLAAFAEKVRDGGGGQVADLGCGPGRVTIHLEGLGLDAYGIDLSPRMVARRRRAAWAGTSSTTARSRRRSRAVSSAVSAPRPRI